MLKANFEQKVYLSGHCSNTELFPFWLVNLYLKKNTQNLVPVWFTVWKGATVSAEKQPTLEEVWELNIA